MIWGGTGGQLRLYIVLPCNMAKSASPEIGSYLLPDRVGHWSLRRHGGIGPGSSGETKNGSAQHWAISGTRADFTEANRKVVWLSSATASWNQSPAGAWGK